MDDADSSLPNPGGQSVDISSGLDNETTANGQSSELPVPIEIERRFLILDAEAIILGPSSHIQQWYLPKDVVARDGKQILVSGVAIAEIQSEAWLSAVDSILDSDNPTVRIRITKQQTILCMKGRSSVVEKTQDSKVSRAIGEGITVFRRRSDDDTEVRERRDEGIEAGGFGRLEMEWQLDSEVAKSLLRSNDWPQIEKTRHFVPTERGMIWEIDQFLGRHEGLWIAEIELNSEDEKFEFPDWLGEEVSRNFQYSNQFLASN
jgi:CYTH domain-containing protein